VRALLGILRPFIQTPMSQYLPQLRDVANMAPSHREHYAAQPSPSSNSLAGSNRLARSTLSLHLVLPSSGTHQHGRHAAYKVNLARGTSGLHHSSLWFEVQVTLILHRPTRVPGSPDHLVESEKKKDRIYLKIMKRCITHKLNSLL
jgi:hypothetical protein